MDTGKHPAIDRNGLPLEVGDWVHFRKTREASFSTGRIVDISINAASAFIEVYDLCHGVVLCSLLREEVVRLTSAELMLIKLEN